jgi:transketolase
MRTRFFADLLEAGRENPDLVLVTGDLGFGVVEPFVEALPEQFINAGVAEQNMTGMAAGIALAGGKVFTYSIANFPTLRCLEQIRNDVAYHGADVTVVAVGGGLAYGALGMSHHATEDLAIMRSIPGMAVAAPGDPIETSAVLADILERGGPAYLRLGKAGEPSVHSDSVRADRGTSLQMRRGSDICLITTGGMLALGHEACERLEQLGISCSHISMPWLSPFDAETVAAAGLSHRLVTTLEEHSISGGLGGASAEVLAETESAAPLFRLGLPHAFSSVVGDQEYLRNRHGLTTDAIADRIAIRLEKLS